MIERILDEGRVSMRQLAEEAGVSYDTLRSWAIKRTRPKPESLRRLAEGLRRQGGRFNELAEELEGVAEREEAA